VEQRELLLLGIFLGEVVRENTGLNWVRGALLYFGIGEEEGEKEGELLIL